MSHPGKSEGQPGTKETVANNGQPLLAILLTLNCQAPQKNKLPRPLAGEIDNWRWISCSPHRAAIASHQQNMKEVGSPQYLKLTDPTQLNRSSARTRGVGFDVR